MCDAGMGSCGPGELAPRNPRGFIGVEGAKGRKSVPNPSAGQRVLLGLAALHPRSCLICSGAACREWLMTSHSASAGRQRCKQPGPCIFHCPTATLQPERGSEESRETRSLETGSRHPPAARVELQLAFLGALDVPALPRLHRARASPVGAGVALTHRRPCPGGPRDCSASCFRVGTCHLISKLPSNVKRRK